MQQRLPSLLDVPITFAHRGARSFAAENTIAAFQTALDRGVSGIESDVWLTADGVPVLVHDGVLGKVRVLSTSTARSTCGNRCERPQSRRRSSTQRRA